MTSESSGQSAAPATGSPVASTEQPVNQPELPAEAEEIVSIQLCSVIVLTELRWEF